MRNLFGCCEIRYRRLFEVQPDEALDACKVTHSAIADLCAAKVDGVNVRCSGENLDRIIGDLFVRKMKGDRESRVVLSELHRLSSF